MACEIADRCMYCGRQLGDARGRTEPVCSGCKQNRRQVVITTQHARSLAALVQYFQNMRQLGHFEEDLGRVEIPEGEDQLTSAYCDELLEDLG